MKKVLSQNETPKPSEERIGKIIVEGDLDSEKYGHIANQIMSLQSFNVSKIVLEINSNGGEVSGIDKALLAINLCTIPIVTLVTGVCASSAYWLASQTDNIVALGANVRLGSIGVFASMLSSQQYMQSIGVQEWYVVSEGSPKKIVTTEAEFLAQEQPVVNEICNNFIKDVAKGRSISSKEILSQFGGGSLLLARQALDVGMIDAIFGETKKPSDELISMQEMQLPESILESKSLEVVAVKQENTQAKKEKTVTASVAQWNQISSAWQQDSELTNVGCLIPLTHQSETFYEKYKRNLNVEKATSLPTIF